MMVIKKTIAEKSNESKSSKSNDSKFNGEPSLDFLRDIATIVAGKNAGQIVDLLVGKKHINEFTIAKRLELTINQTRNILYKLADEGLVSSIRKKDKKKGWYTYFWIFNSDKAFILLQKNTIKDIDQLEHQLRSREVKQFYICPTCHYEVTEETALLHDFTCLECGEIYQIKDNTQLITEIKSKIAGLRRSVGEVNVELEVIEGKRLKRLEREKKKLEKEKTEKRKKAAEARRKLKKKEEKKNKKPKKKVVKKPKKKPKKKVVKKPKKKVLKKKSSSKKKSDKNKKTKNKQDKKKKKSDKNKKTKKRR